VLGCYRHSKHPDAASLQSASDVGGKEAGELQKGISTAQRLGLMAVNPAEFSPDPEARAAPKRQTPREIIYGEELDIVVDLTTKEGILKYLTAVAVTASNDPKAAAAIASVARQIISSGENKDEKQLEFEKRLAAQLGGNVVQLRKA
jgi:hypothetical protein